jgi:hypothetical protein
MEEDAGVYAAKAAVRIAHALIFEEAYDLDRRYTKTKGNQGRYQAWAQYRLYCR